MKRNESAFVIIDTSALIEANTKPSSKIGAHVKSLIESGLAAITPIIRWEMGRGRILREQRIELLELLDSLDILDWKMDWLELEKLDKLILGSGFTVPLTDLWIARTAMEARAFLLHQDKHFDHIACCTPLRIWNPS